MNLTTSSRKLQSLMRRRSNILK